MRLSALPECSLALMHASMMAWAISSMDSEAIPSSRARLPVARAAAISMSGIIGSVSSICRSAVAVMSAFSRSAGSEREKESGHRLDPGGDAAQEVQRNERVGVERQHARQDRVGRKDGFEPGSAGLRDVVHGCPPCSSGLPLRNATATAFRPAQNLLTV